MTLPWITRRYEASDREKVFELYQAVYGRAKADVSSSNWLRELELNPYNLVRLMPSLTQSLGDIVNTNLRTTNGREIGVDRHPYPHVLNLPPCDTCGPPSGIALVHGPLAVGDPVKCPCASPQRHPRLDRANDQETTEICDRSPLRLHCAAHPEQTSRS